MHDFESGVASYIHGQATVDVFFPVDKRGDADVCCYQCYYFRRNYQTCGLNGEIVATYRSATEASEQTGINYWHICECCRKTGKRHRAGGYHWNFLMNMEETNNESI